MNKKLITSSIPPLIYGTAWKMDRTAELVIKATLSGFRGIDTACQPKHYHEAGVGQAIKELEKQGIKHGTLFIQTKFTPLGGQDPNKLPYDPKAEIGDQVRQSFECSLKNLGVDYIDSWVLHSPLATHEQTMLVWKEMEKIYLEGSVGLLGISNCYELLEFKSIYRDAAIKPAVLQNRFYKQTAYDQQLRDWCREKEIHYQGFWTLTANSHLLSHFTVRSIAAAKGVTEAQLFYRFLTQIEVIPLTGTCSEKHMQEDLAIFDFELSDAELAKMDALIQMQTYTSCGF